MKYSPEILPQPQRSDLGIQEVLGPSEVVTLSRDDFPWITSTEFQLPLTDITLINKRHIRYGSVVSENATLRKLASKVSEQNSISAERSMFKALPAILDSRTAANIDIVPNTAIYKTTKRGGNVPRIFFTVLDFGSERPIVAKLAVANHKDQQQVYCSLTGSKHRRNKQN